MNGEVKKIRQQKRPLTPALSLREREKIPNGRLTINMGLRTELLRATSFVAANRQSPMR